ncbi:MAG: ArsR family transcriptional regulator [Alphaproteobacteria bacterium]|nr:ArsR family transcriptional regulator [Alphaproteobacteria bacterium]
MTAPPELRREADNGGLVALAAVPPEALAVLRQNAGSAAALLKALGNESRLLVLCHLCQQERSVTQLEALVGLSQSALSQHLARLRRDGLVVTLRAAQTIYYSLGSEAARRVIAVLYDLFCAPRAPSRGADGQA